MEAESPYAAWASLRDSDTPLKVGDLLECKTGELRICKYVGFEEAHWVIPEAKIDSDSSVPNAAPASPQDPRSD